MIKVYQDKKDNCLEASLASVLEVDIKKVPSFKNTRKKWWPVLHDFLKRYGLYPVYVGMDDIRNNWVPQGYYLLTGKSPRVDGNHVIVCKDRKRVHDPYRGGKCRLKKKEYYILFISRMESRDLRRR